MKIDFASPGDLFFLKKESTSTKSTLKYKIDNKEIIIAYNNESPVGYLILDYLWDHVPFISFIKVTEGNRRKGIGKALLKYLEIYLMNNDQSVLFSSSMENAMEAQTWHRKMGFSESGLIHNINEDNIGEIFFRKVLN